jgi:hypothetical protein
MLWQYSQRRNQATLRGVENSDVNFMLAGPEVHLCLSTEQGFTGYLTGSAGHQVTRNVLSHKLGASSGLET